jgi:hypothetical protein
VSPPAEDLVDALPGDVESAGKLALARSRLVRGEHGLAELLPGPVQALQGLVGDAKAPHDLLDLRFVAHLETI